jgi:hypothetical protein
VWAIGFHIIHEDRGSGNRNANIAVWGKLREINMPFSSLTFGEKV